MKKSTKAGFNVLGTIGKVSDKLKGTKCKPRKTKEFLANVALLNGYFRTTDSETWMLCAIINYYFENHGCTSNFPTLAEFFDCSVLGLQAYRSEFESLLKKRYISNKETLDETEIGLENAFELSRELLSCISKNRILVISDCVPVKKTVIDMVKAIGECVYDQDNSADSHNELLTLTFDMEEKFKSENFLKRIFERGLANYGRERIFLYYCCYNFMLGCETNVDQAIHRIYDKYERMDVARSFLEENNNLLKNGFIEFTKKGTLTDAQVTITQKTKELLFEENIDLYTETAKGTNIILPEKIAAKKLFYSAENETEINRLTSSLQEDNLKSIQERLCEKGLPKGIAVLLYGAPGTGKTESVYQIAKETGRKIFHVDISGAKSCWFGDSEKRVKKIFTDYSQLCKASRSGKDGKMPILLFNEADGILSKRRDVGSSNVAQTENAIQNIILEEMEKLEGIMICTTNLAGNLDSAFERRFLFKIKFENPGLEAKKKIWKSKLDWLNDDVIETVAQNYDLSGGQIDNIVRKITMDEVLTGSRPDFDALSSLCKNEKICGDERRIGFF